jgi:hypothetical protein
MQNNKKSTNNKNINTEQNTSDSFEEFNENWLLDKKERLTKATDQLQEQINFIREQFIGKKGVMQAKTQVAVENAKNQIIEITKKIEYEINSIKKDAKVIEAELLNSQKKERSHNI